MTQSYTEPMRANEFITYGLEHPELLDQILKIRRESSVRDSRFDINLAEGQFAEDVVKSILGDANAIEVKLDERAAETGNLLVEYAKNYKPTGIAVTKADWYAFVFGGKLNKEVVLMVKTERLRELINSHGKTNPMSGVGDKSEFVLLPVKEVIK